MTLLAAVAGCSSADRAAESGATTAAMPTPVTWQCLEGYQVKEGLNIDFPHQGMKRAFVVYPPPTASGPAPLWVPMTGSVESTNDNLTVPRSGSNALMAQHGYLVIGPVRVCANQNPNVRGQVCNGPGGNGWNWSPWSEGRASDASGNRWKTEEGADSSFLIDEPDVVSER